MEARRDDDLDEPHLGDVPEGVGADLYPRHLEYLSRHEAFQEAVLSFPDSAGGRHDLAIHEVEDAQPGDEGPSRARIRLRSGAVVLASGAVIAVALAAIRYRRRHRRE
jgi:hypothetical protein